MSTADDKARHMAVQLEASAQGCLDAARRRRYNTPASYTILPSTRVSTGRVPRITASLTLK